MNGYKIESDIFLFLAPAQVTMQILGAITESINYRYYFYTFNGSFQEKKSGTREKLKIRQYFHRKKCDILEY